MLPPPLQAEARAEARRNASSDALHFRAQLHGKRKYGASLYYAVWAFRLQPSARNLLCVVKSALRASTSRRGRRATGNPG
jgi:hypothetical protein